MIPIVSQQLPQAPRMVVPLENAQLLVVNLLLAIVNRPLDEDPTQLLENRTQRLDVHLILTRLLAEEAVTAVLGLSLTTKMNNTKNNTKTKTKTKTITKIRVTTTRTMTTTVVVDHHHLVAADLVVLLQLPKGAALLALVVHLSLAILHLVAVDHLTLTLRAALLALDTLIQIVQDILLAQDTLILTAQDILLALDTLILTAQDILQAQDTLILTVQDILQAQEARPVQDLLAPLEEGLQAQAQEKDVTVPADVNVFALNHSLQTLPSSSRVYSSCSF